MDTGGGRLEVTAILSSEQLEEPALQTIFGLKHFVVKDAAFQKYNFDKYGLGRLFGDRTKLAIIGVQYYVWIRQVLTPHVDCSEEGRRFSQGTVQHLLDGDQATNGRILSTTRVPMSPSDYPPPKSLASDLAAFIYTDGEPFCKLRIGFPELETRWVYASTCRAFGDWIEEQHGFCSYINVLAGSAWVVISKPKAQGGRTFANITTLTNRFDPKDSNLELWDVEAILLGEGSQL